MQAEPDLYDALDELLLELGGDVPAGSIVRWFARSVTELQVAGVDAGLAVAAQAMTRHRLRLHVPSRIPA
ncbi:MAG TPA: hypothetical protein VFH66_11905 [Mycobacteriales bacterium]|nr:hypothetical protein [Mycobacteriales bacterium]